MTTTTERSCTPCNEPGPCGSLPPGFSRLRYFFGKRLAASDFVDEQRYHVLARRFLNQRLHGAGVLCGLGLSLLDEDGTVVRVRSGAALDRCGREILVGVDQCIDVDAWYRVERAARRAAEPGSTWPATELDPQSGHLRLCVTLRYRDCPAHPEPAPRDPCSCAEGGCEYGRVEERYELELALESAAAPAREVALFPPRAELERAVGSGARELRAELARLVTGACPTAGDEDRLVLGCFEAELAADGESVTKILELHGTPFLLSTAALQHLLLQRIEGSGDLIAAGGPRVSNVSFERDTTTPDAYRIQIALSSAVVPGTVDADHFRLAKLDPSTGWDPPGGGTLDTRCDASGELVTVTVANAAGFLADGGLYRLELVEKDWPIVDAQMRPLQPLRFAFGFGLSADASGELHMTPAPFHA